jgi:hypothetical protein
MATVVDKKQAALLKKIAESDRRAMLTSPLPNLKIEDGKSSTLSISNSYEPGLIQAKFSEDHQKVQLSFTYPKDKDGKEISAPVSETLRLGETLVLHTTQYSSTEKYEPSLWQNARNKLMGYPTPTAVRELQEGFFLLTPRSSAQPLAEEVTPEKIVASPQPSSDQLPRAKRISDLTGCLLDVVFDRYVSPWEDMLRIGN